MKADKTIKTNEANLALAGGADLNFLPDFTADEYVDSSARVPRITALRGELDPGTFGLFVKLQDAADVSLSIPEGMEPITYTYNNGDKEVGYLFQKDFGMCVIPLSPLLAFTRSQDSTSSELPEAYDASKHKGDPSFSPGKIYDVLLVSGGVILHESPLRLIIRGAASATFAKAWEDEVTATGKLYALTKGRRYRPMNYEFNRLCIYCPVMARELAGKEQKSAALVFKSQPNDRPLSERLITTQHELVAAALIPSVVPLGQQPLLMAEMSDDMPF